MRLGEFFIQKGIITRPQLEQALRAQLIFGGHLGTCLMEMGLIDEQLLGESLASIFGVRYAPPGLFGDIPRSVIETMPQRLVEKHHAVPFERTSRMLHVAMIDPKNLPALDEISFATACKIEPWVAPEARIFQVMERYYDIPRRQRYISVCHDMDRGVAGDRPRAAVAETPRPALANTYAPAPYLAALEKVTEPAPPPAPPPTFVAPAPMSPEPEEEEGGPPPAPPMFRPAAPPASPTPEPTPPSRPMRAATPPAPAITAPPTTGRAAAVAPVAGPQIAAPAASRDPDPLSQEALSNRLCLAETAEDLSRCALEYASRGLERCALFLMRATTASLWCSRGLGWDQERGRILNLSVTSDPLFELLLERDHYRGPVPEDVGIHASFKSMRIEVPSEVLLVPGYVEDRLVVLLYGDGGVNGAIRGETADQCAFVKKLAYALHVVMLKRKIRSLDLRPPAAHPLQAA